MDLLALSLGKAVCDASTAIVYAARCSDISTLRPIGYRLARLDRSRARVERHPARGAAVEDPGQPRREEWRDIAVALERRDRAKPFSSGGRSSAAAGSGGTVAVFSQWPTRGTRDFRLLFHVLLQLGLIPPVTRLRLRKTRTQAGGEKREDVNRRRLTKTFRHGTGRGARVRYYAFAPRNPND